MKNYTAIYDTKAIKGINYSFKAKDFNAAINFAKSKFDLEFISNFSIIES